MKKVVICVLVLALLAGGAYVATLRGQIETAAPSAAQAAPAAEASGQTIAEARVVPLRSAALSLSSGGIVAEVLVKEGDQVAAGQVLARLDDADLKLALARAQVDLEQAKADEQALLQGTTPEEIAAARARIAQAEGQYRQAAGSVTKSDITAAQARLAAAQAQLAALQAGHTDGRDAELALQQAQIQLQTRRDQLSAAKTDAQLRMQQRVQDLTKAQSAYATAMQNWQYVQDSGKDPIAVVDPQTGKRVHMKLDDKQRQQYHDAFVQAEAAMHNAETAVTQAQVEYDTTRQAEITGVQAAELDVAATRARLDAQHAGGDSQQLAAARAQVAAAQAELNRLTGASRSGEVAAAQAGVQAAEAELARITADPESGALARAAAAVARAELAIKQAQRAIDLATLTAPFAGTIAALDLKEREYIAPGAPAVQLADVDGWQIETSDLTELNVVNVHEGDAVTVTFDAIPGLELPGKVSRIRDFGENRQGDITYKVVITPDRQDARLRWNMTATVSIAR